MGAVTAGPSRRHWRKRMPSKRRWRLSWRRHEGRVCLDSGRMRPMLRLPFFAIVCSGLAMAAACGPLSAPLPRRLTPDRQQDVDEAWDRALSPVTKYDRVTWLDVLIVRQPYEVGVDKFEFKSEKRFSGGVVEMESRFDRTKPDEDLFVV